MAKGSRGGRRGPSDPSSSSVARWEKPEDIPLDKEDVFHNNRDKVLLEAQSDDDDELDIGGDQREVLKLDGSDLEDSDEDIADSSEEAEEGDQQSGRGTRQYKRLEKERLAREAAPLSDDEDMSHSDSEEVDIARWGSNKRAYYNTNDMDGLGSDSEIDEEEAKRLELEEVKKLQAKTRRGMEDIDFGLGEADELGGAEEGGKGVKDRERRRAELDGSSIPAISPSITFAQAAATPPTEELPSDPIARASLLVQLQKSSPETIALAGEYADAVDQMIRIKSTLPEFERRDPQHKGLGMIHMHYQALATYVTTLTFYFHLRASAQHAFQSSSFSQDLVLDRILKLKEGLTIMEDLGFALPTEDELAEDEIEESEVQDDLETLWSGRNGGRNFFAPAEGEDDEEGDELGDLDEDELAQLMADAKAHKLGKRKTKSDEGATNEDGVKKSKQGKKRLNEGATSVKKKSDGDKKKKQQKEKKMQAAQEAPLAKIASDLSSDPLSLAPQSTRRKSSVPSSSMDSTSSHGESYGEATSLSLSELEDKANKKRSLRFYTGQMDAKEARREAGARERMGGDNDIPYRDRERSRLAVEQAKASREGKLNVARQGAALDEEEWGEGDSRDWRDVMGVAGQESSGAIQNDDDEDGEGDYYDLVAGARKQAKRAKKEEHDSERDSSRIIDETSLEPGAHRSLTRQIATNRGLTPHRKQDRNLRVKKRKKFEKAQKKLSSTRAVYTGGQGNLQGGYSGESSGINAQVAKSRRFAN